MTVSVVMATYNGEKNLVEQLNSILPQLTETDELIISDDGSTDNTIEIIKSFQNKYSNIRLYRGPHKGVENNFANAIYHTKGEIVFISDQDDIWELNKIKTVVDIFDKNRNINIVLHNGAYFKDNANKNVYIFDVRKTKHGVLNNIILNTYYGCCMALRKGYLLNLMPLPQKTLYDQYLGLCAERDRCSYFCNDILIYHRVHENNWSSHQGFFNKTKIRIKLIIALFKNSLKHPFK